MNEAIPRIKTSDRVALVGSTGSGKSTWAQVKLAGVRRLVVIDPKGNMDKKKWNLQPWKTGYKELLKRNGSARLYVGPLSRSGFDALFAYLLTLRNVLIYIDELYAVGPDQGSQYLRALYTMGRALGLGVWAATQRPKRVPPFAFSEAEFIVTFRLGRRADRQFMVEEMGDQGKIYQYPPLRNYEYVIYNAIVGGAVRYPPLKVST